MGTLVVTDGVCDATALVDGNPNLKQYIMMFEVPQKQGGFQHCSHTGPTLHNCF